MKFESFYVTNYRNIRDSGWVDVNAVTAFVGQNESGKSNFFEALYRLNPYKPDARYNIEEDWPIDDLDNKNEKAVVCQAKFTLNEDDINSLYEYVFSGMRANAEEGEEEEEEGEEEEEEREEEVEEGEEEKAVLDIKKPKSLILLGTSYYKHLPFFQIEGEHAKILDEGLVDEWAKENLPKFVYINDYGMFDAQIELNKLQERKADVGWAGLNNNEQAILIVLDLAKINLEDFVKKGESPEGRTNRPLETQTASNYLTEQFQNFWRQKNVEFKISVDGNTLNIFVQDKGMSMPVRLNKRSTGFRWHVSFAWKFTHASNGDYKNCVLLLEEPGIYLHYDGQKDLIRLFEELSKANTIIYTTHLASMVDLECPERIRIVESDEDGHATAKRGVVSSSKSPMAVIEQSLGLSGDMSGFLGKRKSLIVEGGDDALILYKLSGILKASGRMGLADEIYLWIAQGASKTPTYASFAAGNGWSAGVLLDSDEEGEKAKEKIKKLGIVEQAKENKKTFPVLMLREVAGMEEKNVTIEDIFPEKLYIEWVNKAYGLDFGTTTSELSQDGSTMIVKKIEHVLEEEYDRELDKELIREQMLKEFDEWKTIDDLPEGTKKKAEKLFESINKAFSIEGASQKKEVKSKKNEVEAQKTA